MRDEELNVKKTIAVIDVTFAVAKRKPEKKKRAKKGSIFTQSPLGKKALWYKTTF